MKKKDTKVDIKFEYQDTTSELTEEEQARQNYDTAMRYIEIAEHMKQYEDQEKYYHRAIRYLKKSRPYFDCKDEINEMRVKKCTARAAGRVALYQEACSIRDRAQTPNDYFSAQTIFLRIHNYAQGHKLYEKYTPPDLYQAALRCSDAKEKADECERLAASTEARQKKQSLLMSVLVVLAIFAFLAFSRTIYFKYAQGYFNKMVGDNASAWAAFDNIYTRNQDPKAYENYLECRYKAAGDAASSDPETACNDYHAVALENYKDSAKKLAVLEQQIIKDTPLSELAYFGGYTWRVLAKNKKKALLIKDEAISGHPFSIISSRRLANQVTWSNSDAREWLSGDFMDETFVNAEQDIMIEKKIDDAGGSPTIDKIFLLSIDEVRKYDSSLHETKSCWWLRSPGVTAGTMCFVYTNKNIMYSGYDLRDTNFTLKPAVWISLK